MTITIFTKRGCQYCDKLKNFLSLYDDLTLNLIEIKENSEREKMLSILPPQLQIQSKITFPQVFIGKEYIPGGCEGTIQYLSAKGIVIAQGQTEDLGPEFVGELLNTNEVTNF